MGRGGDPPLRGTFLQFWAAHLEWEPERWNRLFGYLRAMRVRELIIQWSGYDGIDYAPLVERVLSMAEPHWMCVKVGLRYESRWWRDLDADPSDALKRVEQRAAESALDLERLVKQRRAFAGWYLPEEFDDAHWSSAVPLLGDSLKSVRSRVARLSVSGFTNRTLAPRRLAEFWRAVASRSGVDEVLFQDGIGAGKMPLNEWPAYAAALKVLGGRLTFVVETFEQPGRSEEFRATSAPMDRVLAQCRIARQYSRRAPIAFSLPEYDTPAGGVDAERRYEEYLQRLG